MDFKRTLFEIERITPRVGRKLWRFASILSNPEASIFWDVAELNDEKVRFRFVGPRFTTGWAVDGAEQAIRMLLGRHVNWSNHHLMIEKIELIRLAEDFGSRGLFLESRMSLDVRNDLLQTLWRGGKVGGFLQAQIVDRENSLCIKIDVNFKLNQTTGNILLPSAEKV